MKMKGCKKVTLLIIIILTILIVCLALFSLWSLVLIHYSTTSGIKQIEEKTVRLMYETDHKALLLAGRKVLEESRIGKWEQQKQYIISTDDDPNITNLPKIILDLNPSYIVIYDEDSMSIEMMGGMHHFGVRIYREHFEKPSGFFEFGDKQLLDGLWYYDEGYQEDPNYDEFIESLRPDG